LFIGLHSSLTKWGGFFERMLDSKKIAMKLPSMTCPQDAISEGKRGGLEEGEA
jgi:hypothetical protein